MDDDNGYLYHNSDALFSEGDMISPRRREVIQGMPFSYHFVESVFEYIREAEFSDRPSRFDSVFLTTDPKFFPNKRYSYVVEFEGNSFLTDQRFYSQALMLFYDAYLVEDVAREYWSCDCSKLPEILVDGKVRVVKKL